MYARLIAAPLNKAVYFKKERAPNIVIFSGGSGARGLARELKKQTHAVSYIIPISDNGGSTYEIMRYFGGPAIGDIRSRLCDLSPNHTQEAESVTKLLTSRIHTSEEWDDIVIGKPSVYDHISSARKELIRSDFLFCDQQIKIKAPKFAFANASLGNLFLTGIRLRTNSLDAAILQFSDMAQIPEKVLPIISSNEALTIAATLENKEIIYGQNNISHPVEKGMNPTYVNKDYGQPLSAKIKSLHYIDIHFDKKTYQPAASPEVLEAIYNADRIVYSMGSFWTSIMPNLIVGGMAEAIAHSSAEKIFILNGTTDRETGLMTAVDLLDSIQAGLNNGTTDHPITAFVNTMTILDNTDIPIPVLTKDKARIIQRQFQHKPESHHYNNTDLVRLLLGN